MTVAKCCVSDRTNLISDAHRTQYNNTHLLVRFFLAQGVGAIDAHANVEMEDAIVQIQRQRVWIVDARTTTFAHQVGAIEVGPPQQRLGLVAFDVLEPGLLSNFDFLA